MAYTSFARLATDMHELVKVTDERLDHLSLKVVALDSELYSMMKTVHDLSALPHTRSQLNAFLLNTYNPAALALVACTYQRDCCGHNLELMSAAMLEPRFIHDLEVQSTRLLSEKMCSMLITEAESSIEVLVAQAEPMVNKESIKSMLGPRRLCRGDCMDKPSSFEEGAYGSVSINTSGRSWACDWFTPVIVLKCAVIPTHGRVCAVCHIDERHEGNIVVRIVKEEDMLGQPKDGRMM